jgi:hypothetical protein
MFSTKEFPARSGDTKTERPAEYLDRWRVAQENGEAFRFEPIFGENAMFRIFAVIALAVCTVAPAFAAPQTPSETPQAFLQDIYAHYRGSASKGVPLDKDADRHRYFTDGLVALIVTDEKAAAKSGDIPTLDGDPFIDAQDWDVTHLTIHIDTQSATAATATVKFENIKEPKTLHIKLVATQKGWRIDDIAWSGDEGTFRGLYKKK